MTSRGANSSSPAEEAWSLLLGPSSQGGSNDPFLIVARALRQGRSDIARAALETLDISQWWDRRFLFRLLCLAANLIDEGHGDLAESIIDRIEKELAGG